MLTIEDIRAEFLTKLANEDFAENGTLELRGISFVSKGEPIFGKRNKKYLKAELEWYKSATRDVHKLYELYGKEVSIWKDCADDFGRVNSNYGWCIFSRERHYQYQHVLDELTHNPATRQAVMIYTEPDMHTRSKQHGMWDFTCTNTVQYFIRNGILETYVHMRSNDAIFGYLYDFPWQKWVSKSLVMDLRSRGLDYQLGPIQWSVGSFHIYPRHFGLLDLNGRIKSEIHTT